MQAKKSKQLLKARLARERQIYEMRKRAELKAAVSELERPWEIVEKAPTLFSVSADEQLKVLADRFQKPGGFDMWSERDGPELFKTGNGLPSARYFPKGVVHSIKPYGKVEKFDDGSGEFEGRDADVDSGRSTEGEGDRNREVGGPRVGDKFAKVKNGMFNVGKKLSSISGKKFSNPLKETNNRNGSNNKFRNNNSRRNSLSSSNSTRVGSFRGKNERNNRLSNNVMDSSRHNSKKIVEGSKSMVFDLTLQKDGSYEIEPENR